MRGKGLPVPGLPASVPEPLRASISAAAGAWAALPEPRLRSLVLFGSVARGESTARSDVDLLATISTEMAGNRGIAFYGDERQGLGPRELFTRADAERAARQLDHVAALCARLLDAADDDGGAGAC